MRLGDERARRFHVHFSRIEFSAGGEKRHWTFAETQFAGAAAPDGAAGRAPLEPVIICESAGTQAGGRAGDAEDVRGGEGVTSQALRASSPKGRAFNGFTPHFLSFSSSFLPKPLAKWRGIG
ncbi:MAG: hypothetical protein ACLUIR_07445 [Faecalibacterium prausnitzii]